MLECIPIVFCQRAHIIRTWMEMVSKREGITQWNWSEVVIFLCLRPCEHRVWGFINIFLTTYEISPWCSRWPSSSSGMCRLPAMMFIQSVVYRRFSPEVIHSHACKSCPHSLSVDSLYVFFMYASFFIYAILFSFTIWLSILLFYIVDLFISIHCLYMFPLSY